jgi:hypothetical protein
MQYFIDSATSGPYAFDDNVTATKDANGVYTFTYTTGERLPETITPATYAPDTLGELGEVIEKGALLTPEVITPGELINYPVYAPATLQPCTLAQFTAAQQRESPTA